MVQSQVVIDGQSVLSSIPHSLIIDNLGEKGEVASTDNLKTAFNVFNDLSLQLADAYQHLEHRVAELTSELDTVSEQRYRELKQKEKLACRLETLINVLPGGVVVLDKQGVIIESNPVAESLLTQDLKGKHWRDIVDYCFVPRNDDGHEVSNREGKRISISTRSLDEDGQIILLIDQTETRRLQEDVSRNQRLSALGKMVSTLAHQVRTPLSSAMLYGSHLCNQQLTEIQRQIFTQKLLNRLNYMERQVQDMLLFVKGDVPLKDKITVNQLQESLAEAIEMPINAYKASCKWQINSDNCVIQCNLDAITGALLNLVNNSLQAISPAAVIISFEQMDSKLLISIMDNGPGLSPEFKHKREEMFFTTKDKGTGIGLSVVNIVAQSHGGRFSIENRANRNGVCACLELPIVGECHY